MSDREGYLKRRDQLLMQDEEIAELKAELAALLTLAKAVAEGSTGIVLHKPQSRELSAAYMAPKIMPLKEYAKSLLQEKGE